MKRNLITTVKISKGYVTVICLEKISTELVEIFSDTKWIINSLEKTKFIKESINIINRSISGKIKSVVAIVESNKKTDFEINMIEKQISIPSSFVTPEDIDNAIVLSEKEGQIEGKQIILVQPVKFFVMDFGTKIYDKAPLNKKGHTLKVNVAVSTINSKMYQYVKDVILGSGLTLSQVLVDTQLYSHETISGPSLVKGAISIHVGIKRTSISINANSAVVANMELPLGFLQLIKKVSEQFVCLPSIASNLIKAYGSIKKGNNEVIYTSQQGMRIISYTDTHLNSIIKQFVTKIMQYSNAFISKYSNIKMIPIIISGEIEQFDGIEEFVKSDLFLTNYVQIYKPLTFIASNKVNMETIGVVNFIERFDKIIGKDFNSIIITNPNIIDPIIGENKKLKWFSKKIKGIIKAGGKYVRTSNQ